VLVDEFQTFLHGNNSYPSFVPQPLQASWIRLQASSISRPQASEEIVLVDKVRVKSQEQHREIKVYQNVRLSKIVPLQF
jgi:hypothetical protein